MASLNHSDYDTQGETLVTMNEAAAEAAEPQKRFTFFRQAALRDYVKTVTLDNLSVKWVHISLEGLLLL